MIKFKSEIHRKLVHLSSLWIPLSYLYFSEETMNSLLFVLTGIAIIIELCRKYSPELNNLIQNTLGSIMRMEEQQTFSGATYLLLSSSLTILFFSKEVAIFALCVLMISDTCAAIIGRKFGKHIYAGKSLEGSMAFFFSALLVYFVCKIFFNFPLSFNVSLFAIFIATIVEFFAKQIKLDDNLVIPLTIGLIEYIN
jgi:dolichol kinase